MNIREIKNIIDAYDAKGCQVHRNALQRLLTLHLEPEVREMILKALDEPVLIVK